MSIDISKFRNIISNIKKANIFTHPFPDPDAIGSMMGMKWIFSKLGIESELFYFGGISHPQNKSMVNLLDLELTQSDNYAYRDCDFNV
jgi:nanoRNase/pAp phosphatase (c-di-AMP/oligoRNAs hydrolase)